MSLYHTHADSLFLYSGYLFFPFFMQEVTIIINKTYYVSSHSGDYEEDCVLGCDAILSGGLLPTSSRNLLPPFPVSFALNGYPYIEDRALLLCDDTNLCE